jgi:hypothetical protein
MLLSTTEAQRHGVVQMVLPRRRYNEVSPAENWHELPALSNSLLSSAARFHRNLSAFNRAFSAKARCVLVFQSAVDRLA